MESSEAVNPKLVIIIGTVITILGIVALITGYFTNSWEAAKGRIISSRVVSDDDHYAEVKYEYVVGGIKYTGHSISNADGVSMSYDEANDIINKYYPGREVDVYYDAGVPDRAVLERGISANSYFPMAVGFLVLITGIFVLRDKPREIHSKG